MANSKVLSPFSIAVRMLIVSVVLKMLVFLASKQFTYVETIANFLNVFILMSGVFFGIWYYRKSINTSEPFLNYVKEGMKVAAFYAILMTAFVYIYYTYIDSSYFELKLAKQLELAATAGDNVDLKQAKEIGQMVLSPFFQSTITLIGFLLLGSFYSAIIAFLLKKFKVGF